MFSLFALTNLFYTFIFLLTKEAGGLYRWFIKEADFLEIGAFPYTGPTYYFAENMYRRHDWLLGRFILVGWLIFMALLVVLFFTLFSVI